MIMRKRGFTLIELLVVVAIIGLLASVVLASLSTARQRARDAYKIAELKQLQTALELYRNSNTGYPVTTGWEAGSTACNATYGAGNSYTGANGYIPGLAPTYISVLPEVGNLAANKCFLYNSNGRDYKLLVWNAMENYVASSPLIDPGFSGTPPNCTTVPGRANTYAVYTDGGKCF